MKRLLAIELQKIWKNKASRALTLAYFVLLSSIALISVIKFDIGPIHIRIADQGIFNFPFIWHANTYIASWLKLFFAIVIVSMMANEYSYGTLKQNLIDGMSKKEFILSKFLTVLLFTMVSTIFIFMLTLILGYFFSSYTEIGIVFSDLDYIAAYFINLLGFFSMCLFVGILVKRSAFALGFLLVWWFWEVILIYIVNIPKFLVKLLPMEALSNLIVEPVTRFSIAKSIGNQMGIQNTKDYSVHWSGILIVTVWTIIFVILSYKLLKKRDL